MWEWLVPVVLVAAAAIVVALVAASLIRQRTSQRAPLVAALGGIRLQPAFRRALRSYRSIVALGLVACVVGIGVAAVAASRPIATATMPQESRNRDIVLCLDVSGSMSRSDAEVLRTFDSLAKRFSGERVSLVLFDTSPLAVFPLTDDYLFIRAELRKVRDGITSHAYSDGTSVESGSSLIGDGIAGCLLQFDRLDETRSRTVILGTDYKQVGRSVFRPSESLHIAAERQIVVHGINPETNASPAGRQFESDILAGGGMYLPATSFGTSDAVTAIVDSVTSDEATVTRSAPLVVVTDTPELLIWLLAGLSTAVILLSWRARL
jgi:hypothetical protein